MIDRLMSRCNSARTCKAGAILAVLFTQLLAAGGTAAQTATTTVNRTQAKRASEASFDSLKERAMAALNADKLDEAIPLLRKALTLNPRWAEGWWSLGTTLYDQDRYAEASLALKRVVPFDPKNGTARAMLGLCEFEMGADAAALRDIEASKELGVDADPQLRSVVLYHEGVLLQRAGMFVAAEKPFTSLCVASTRNAGVIRGFGMAELRMKDHAVDSADPDAGQVVERVGHAACLAAHKDMEAARKEYAEAVEAYPHFPYIHYAYGRMLNDAQDTAGAVAEFKRELDEGHDALLPLLQIAAAEYKVDSAAGLPYAEQAVELAPKMPFAHFLLGLLLQNTGAYDRAVTELEIASKGLTNDKRVFWALGVAYNQAGRPQDAARARAQFARLNQKPAQQVESSVTGESQDVSVHVVDGAEVAPKN